MSLRRVFVLLMVLCVCVGSTVLAQEQVVLRVVSGLNEEGLQVVKERLAVFEEMYPHIKIELQQEVAGFVPLAERLVLMAGIGAMPDVAHVVVPSVADLINGGVLMDVTAFLERSSLNLDDYIPITDNYLRDGRIYGGFDTHFQLNPFYYNVDSFQRTGLVDPNVLYANGQWTWNALLEAAKKLTFDINGDQIPDIYGVGMHLHFTPDGVQSWLTSNHTSYINESLDRIIIGEPAAVEALQFPADMYNEYRVATYDYTAPGDLATGKIEMLLGGTWLMNWFLTYAPGLNWDIVPFPAKDENTPPLYLRSPGTQGLIINGAAHPEEAWKLLEFFLSPTWQFAVAESRLELPVLKEALSSDAFLSPPPQHMEVLVDMALNSVAEISHPDVWNITSVIRDSLIPGFIGQESMYNAAQVAAQKAQALLDDANK